jgi:hypothetical protein
MTQLLLRQPGYPIALRSVSGAILLPLAAPGTGFVPGASPSRASSSDSSGGCTVANARSSVPIDPGNNLKVIPASACLKADGAVTWQNTGDITHATTGDLSDAAVASSARWPAGAAT